MRRVCVRVRVRVDLHACACICYSSMYVSVHDSVRVSVCKCAHARDHLHSCLHVCHGARPRQSDTAMRACDCAFAFYGLGVRACAVVI
jgi:hypothetical protein